MEEGWVNKEDAKLTSSMSSEEDEAIPNPAPTASRAKRTLALVSLVGVVMIVGYSVYPGSAQSHIELDSDLALEAARVDDVVKFNADASETEGDVLKNLEAFKKNNNKFPADFSSENKKELADLILGLTFAELFNLYSLSAAASVKANGDNVFQAQLMSLSAAANGEAGDGKSQPALNGRFQNVLECAKWAKTLAAAANNQPTAGLDVPGVSNQCQGCPSIPGSGKCTTTNLGTNYPTAACKTYPSQCGGSANLP